MGSRLELGDPSYFFWDLSQIKPAPEFPVWLVSLSVAGCLTYPKCFIPSRLWEPGEFQATCLHGLCLDEILKSWPSFGLCYTHVYFNVWGFIRIPDSESIVPDDGLKIYMYIDLFLIALASVQTTQAPASRLRLLFGLTLHF